ncbi:MAG: META domain-containing protein [Plectolyngbya sp. WJT66-NPBG17]|jgi:heat shock protein HslJ|nr:META domain-containing protein [Plectolyngbya sp. WJT66-NPBG17]
MKKTLITLVLSSLSLLSILSVSNRTIAQSPKYNCLTREVWSPEKQAWCNEQNKAQSTEMNQQLLNTEWLLEDLGGTGVVDRVQTTIRFNDSNRLTGQGGCNRYFAAFQSQESSESEMTFTVGAIGATKKVCSPAVMNQEARYFQALERSQRIRLEGAFLLIDSEDSSQPLKFTRMTEEVKPR